MYRLGRCIPDPCQFRDSEYPPMLYFSIESYAVLAQGVRDIPSTEMAQIRALRVDGADIVYDKASAGSGLVTLKVPVYMDKRVFVEHKWHEIYDTGVTDDIDTRDLFDFQIEQEMTKRIGGLARLLGDYITNVGHMRCLRCIGYIHEDGAAKLVFNLPPHADPAADPVSLQEILEAFDGEKVHIRPEVSSGPEAQHYAPRNAHRRLAAPQHLSCKVV